MATSKGITIRFPEALFDAIQKCADARKKTFSSVVVETCEERLVKHAPTIGDRVRTLEQYLNAEKNATIQNCVDNLEKRVREIEDKVQDLLRGRF